MQGFFGDHWGAKIAALVLAILLWLHVLTDDPYEEPLTVPLRPERIEGVPDGLVIANPVKSEVTVRFRGTGKQLTRLRYSKVNMVLRVTGSQVGKESYLLSASDVRIPPGLEVEAVEVVSPLAIEIDLDHLLKRKLPVEADVAVKIAPGYTKVGPILFEPDSVWVIGPRRFVEDVHSVRLNPLKLSQVDADVLSLVRVIPPPGENVVCTPEEVRVFSDIQAINEQWIEDVPIQLTHAPRGAKVVPPTVDVKVRGGIDQLMSLQTDDIRAYMGYSALAPEEEQPPQPVFILPPGIVLMEWRPQTFRMDVP
ncbi:MAG: CdaR family protein [Candidatus Latescibacterota bacterium]